VAGPFRLPSRSRAEPLIARVYADDESQSHNQAGQDSSSRVVMSRRAAVIGSAALTLLLHRSIFAAEQ
jgi:hypothetical protein